MKAGGDNNNWEATKKDDDQSNATVFQESWRTGRPWLKFDEKENAMFCSYCRQFSKDKSAFGSQKGNNSFRLDGIKKISNK